MAFFSSKKSAVGLDIGAKLVKAVEVEKEGITPKIVRFATATVDPSMIRDGEIADANALRALIDGMFRQHRFGTGNVVVCVDAKCASMAIEGFPARTPRDLESSLKIWERENIAGDVSFSSAPLEKTTDDSGETVHSVLLCWADNRVLEPYMQLFRQLKFGQEVIDIDILATMNALDLASEYKTSLLIEGGATTTNIMIVEGGVLKFLKAVSMGVETILRDAGAGSGVPAGDLERDLRAYGVRAEPPDDAGRAIKGAFDRYCDQIIAEIKPFLVAKKTIKIEKILLTGGLACVMGFGKYLEGIMKKPVDYAAHVQTGGAALPEAERHVYTTALGLAIRGIA